MLGFYVLLEDPDANVIITLALHSALLQLGFFESHDLRYIDIGYRRRRSSQQALLVQL